MSPAPLTAFLVEDEPPCRADFRQTLQHFPEVRLLGEADNLAEARKFLQTHPVQLLFLDLSVGNENALHWVERIPSGPLVIALTAHHQHAARAFTLHWVDYILKPVEPERLQAALAKARHRLATAPLEPGRVTFQAEMDGKTVIVNLSELIMVESMGNYVILHTSRGRAIRRATLKQIRQTLPPHLFLPAARGCVVARAQITGWSRRPSGRLVLNLPTGIALTVSRSQTSGVWKALAHP